MKKEKLRKTIVFYTIVALAAAFLSFGMQSWIESVSLLLAGEQEVVIRMADTENNNNKLIQVLSTGKTGDLFPYLKKAAENDEDWSYSQGETGVSWTLLSTGVKGAELKIKVIPSMEQFVLFHMAGYNGTVEIITDGLVQTLDCHKDEGATTFEGKPFQSTRNVHTVLYRILMHIILFFLCFILILFALRRSLTVCIKESVNARIVIFLFLLSFLFVGLFKDCVNRLIVYQLLPSREVNVSVAQKVDMSIVTGDIRIPVPQADKLLNESEQENAYCAVFCMTVCPEEFIRIAVNEEIKEIKYSIEGTEYTYAVTDADRTAGACRLYPFASSMLKVMLSLLIYLLCAAIFTLLLIMLHGLISLRGFNGGILGKPYSKKAIWFIAAFAVIYTIGLCQYVFRIDLPYYMPYNLIGDQGDYWGTYILKDGFFNLNTRIASFRGYTNYLLPSISKVIGARMHIDSVKIYLVFPALMFAWLTTVIVPELYEMLGKEKSRIISVILYFIVFSYYYKAYITLVLTDLYNSVLFFASILYAVKAYRKQSVIDTIICAVSLSWMINMHYSMGIIMLFFIFGFLFYMLIKSMIDKKGFYIWNLFQRVFHIAKGAVTRKRVICFFLALICFLAICAPQAVLNYNNGYNQDYFGLFPHDSETAYAGKPVSWSMWNTFLSRGMILWPRFIGDDQTDSMKTQLYEKDETLHPAQAMDVYANSPVETAVTLFKKTFAMFDYKSNVNYGTEITWRETEGLVFSFFNYLVLLTALFVLIKKNSLSHMTVLFTWLLFFSSVVTALAGHVEQRSSMIFYTALCMTFTYTFCGEIIRNKKEFVKLCNSGFYQFVGFGQILCFGISMTLWA